MTIHRIGRTPTPAERGYQVIAENPEVLDRAARNLYATEAHGKFPGDKWVTGVQIDSEWAALSDAERSQWKDKALAKMRDHVAESAA